MNVLGLNWGFHDSAVALVSSDRGVLYAAEEERFSGVKAESRFPAHAIADCLRFTGIQTEDVDAIAFGWHPYLMAWERCLLSNLFRYRVPCDVMQYDWRRVRDLMAAKARLAAVAPGLGDIGLRYVRHHIAHAASAICASGYDRGAYLVIDGRGELDAVTFGQFRGGRLVSRDRICFPHSIGRLYSALCRFLGFMRPEKAGTVMAMAAYGEPRFRREFEKLLMLVPKGKLPRLRLDTRYFNLEKTAQPSARMAELFGVAQRSPDVEPGQIHMDIAASLQAHTEHLVLSILRALAMNTGERNLCFAGGVALNSVINGRIKTHTPFENVFIQPAANDAGVALGAAAHVAFGGSTVAPTMVSALLGPSFTDKAIRQVLDQSCVEFRPVRDPALLTAKLVADGKIVCVFQDRMEFGPRALGGRSMLANATVKGVRDRINQLKRREWFRPFGVAVLEHEAPGIFPNLRQSPFMLEVDQIRPVWADRLAPVTHEDGTVRAQTVTPESCPFLAEVLRHFHAITGLPLMLNTSLNTKGKPICCTPEQGLEAWRESGADALVIGGYWVGKSFDAGQAEITVALRETAPS